MQRIVECVPNFSEGRKTETIEQLTKSIESVETAVVLDTHLDADHNRSVITFVAAPERVGEAAFRAVVLAADLIDLQRHVGEHPRIGSTDVLPFIPVRGVAMNECVDIAHTVGKRIAQELGIAVYFYERAALLLDRVNLEHVRRRGFEELREEIASVKERAPDVGEPRVHENAGAIAIGARPFLIAFNVNLQTTELSIARKIARTVRARDGGLPGVKALGFELRSRGLVQVSMNLIDYETTGMQQAYEAVKNEAERYGVGVAATEIVGLVPQAALDERAEYFQKLENFKEDKVLENRLRSRLSTRVVS